MRHQPELEVFGIRREFARSDLFCCCILKAEFANPQAPFGSHWRTENTARHGPRGVEITLPSFWVKDGTTLVVSKVLKRFAGLIENSCPNVAREVDSQSSDGGANTITDPLCARRILFVQLSKPLSQPLCVKLIDREDADTTLSASDTTGKPSSTAADRVGKS